MVNETICCVYLDIYVGVPNRYLSSRCTWICENPTWRQKLPDPEVHVPFSSRSRGKWVPGVDVVESAGTPFSFGGTRIAVVCHQKYYLYLLLQTQLCSGWFKSWTLVRRRLDGGCEDWRGGIGLQQTLHTVSVDQGEQNIICYGVFSKNVSLTSSLTSRLTQTVGISTRMDSR